MGNFANTDASIAASSARACRKSTPDLAAGLSLPRQEGVIVSDILADGPAAKAGLKIGDVIVTLDERPIGALPIAEMIVTTKPAGASRSPRSLCAERRRVSAEHSGGGAERES